MNPAALLIVVVAAGLAALAARDVSVRLKALRILALHERYGTDTPASAGSEHALARWLSAAGYRAANAPAIFVVTTAAFAGVGLVAAKAYRVAVLPTLMELVASAPAGTADLLAAVLQGGPWVLFATGCMLPTMAVRRARRVRVGAIERDLPLVLELFATMAEAGLGFDAALSKIVRTRNSDSPLIAEFVNFQLDLLAGVPRVHALRQLARRVGVPALTRFASALVQAEQAGASTADTLQHQAEDLRQRRREEALLQAQALPVKLVFPLVLCFLPGIFVSTLAPVIHQMIVMANNVLGNVGR
jgi:tight adherence protein C